METSSLSPIDNFINYYDFHAKRYFESTQAQIDTELLNTFSRELTVGSSLLDLGSGSARDLCFFKKEKKFLAQGVERSSALLKLILHSAQLEDRDILLQDFRFWSAPREKFDAIWANQFFSHLSPNEFQRVLGICFEQLKPKARLFFSFRSSKLAEPQVEQLEVKTWDFAAPSLILYAYHPSWVANKLRQAGFQLCSSWPCLHYSGETGVFARRL